MRKRRLILIVGLAVLVLALVCLVCFLPGGELGRQRLPDGTELVLTRVNYGTKQGFSHGAPWEKLLGNAIPSNGVKVGRFQLQRATHEPAIQFDKPWLVAELKLDANPTNAARHPLAGSTYYRQFRCLIRGEPGFECIQEFWAGRFGSYRDGYFGYVMTSTFPRDSKQLWLEVEQRDLPQGRWRSIAKFAIKNPTHPAGRPWVAQPAPISARTDGYELMLGEVTIAKQPVPDNDDIWPYRLLMPFRVQTNGVTLTNWEAADIKVEDATGNWEALGTLSEFTNGWSVHRAWQTLDPRTVWKLEADFSPQTNFAPGSLLTLQVPVQLAKPMTTNCLGVPLEIQWVNQNMLSVAMQTNRANLRLLFVSAYDRKGRDLNERTGSWSQHQFWRSLKLSGAGESIKATIAIVPNVHASFMMQPKFVPAPEADKKIGEN